jgi:hypothetical protein
MPLREQHAGRGSASPRSAPVRVVVIFCDDSSDGGGGFQMSGRLVRRIVFVAVPAVLLFAAPPLTVDATATLNVPADFPTIQAAINAASAGDTVVAAPGTYVENIDFKGKAITVQSAQGPGSTTIDGGNVDRVVNFHTGETRASVLQGFTIQHGLTTSGTNGYDGAGIGISFASPTIQGNVITNNVSGGDGAGVSVYFGSPAILGNTITGNTKAQGWTGQAGGGISLDGADSTNSQVIGNAITNNHSYWGGAMSLDASGSPTISDNWMSGNSAESDGGGIWLVNASSPLMVQNVIIGNQSPTLGGGMFNAEGTFINNTIADNTAQEGAALYNVGSTQLFNNILESSGATAVECATGTSPVLDHNDAFGSGSAGFDGCGSALGSNGNISAAPLFVGSGNYRLQAGSPAIDAGNNSAPSLPAADVDGLPRISGGVVDMGAFEFQEGGVAPSVSVSPASVSFGSQLVGSTTSASVTLTNSGSTLVHFDTVTVSAGSPTFSAAGCTGATLNPGADCVIGVRFTPSTAGAVSGELAVSGSAGALSVPLSGTGVAGRASVQPASLTFGRVRVGRQSAAASITLTNSGNGALLVGAVSLQGQDPADFAIASNSCTGAALAPGATCSMAVVFQPAASGTRAATLTIASDDPASPSTVPLAGTGR